MSELTPPRDAADRLRDIQALTDAALAHLDFDELLYALVDRVREILHVDTAAVLLLDTNSNSLVATAARGIEEEVIQGVRIPVGRGFAGRIAAEKRAVILDHVDHTTVMNPILRDRGIKSLLGVPLLSGGQVLGVLHVGTLHPRDFTPADVELLQVAADRVALAAHARMTEAERTAALALQHSLLPGRLPDVAGIDFAARYVPGEAEGVGGDWYDVFALPSGSLCVVMGDVVGRGLRAAVVMGRLRSTLRAYALTTDDPATILAHVDRKLQHFEPGELATIVLGVLDVSQDVLRISSAGHPVPLLTDPEREPRLLDLPIDPPIGVRQARPRRTTTVPLPRGAVMCLYTDGLVERRRVPLDDRLGLLLRTVTVTTPDAVCARVMQRMVGSDAPADDVAVLVVRIANDEPGEPFELTFPAVPSSLSHVRATLRRWLRGVGASETAVHDVLVAVGEATANAVEHAYGPSGGSISVTVELEGRDVIVAVKDAGQWRAPRGQGRGRGTLIMEKTMDSFSVDRTDAGTTVHLRRDVDR